jgi:hypothetical protein
MLCPTHRIPDRLAFADSVKTPGTPGEKNCVGQTNAWLAQAGQSLGINGYANVAAFSGVTVQQLQAEVQAYCNP